MAAPLSNGTSSSTPAPFHSSSGVDPLSTLEAQVQDRIGRPVDRWAVVATLEAMGLRDADARRHLNLPDLFAAGDAIYQTIGATDRVSPSLSPIKHSTLWSRTARTVASVGRSVLFVAPMALQVAAVLILGYSLWAWLYFTEAQATVVALGTLLSFIVTGGFVQSIGRNGHLYLSQNNPRLADRTCRRLIGLGLLTVGIVTLVLLVATLVFPYYPYRLVGISTAYFVLLSALWLSLSVLYVLDHLSAIVGITLLGLVPVAGVMVYTDWGIHVAHALGLAVAAGCAYGYGLFVFRHRIRRSPSPSSSDTLPPLSIQIHSLRHYFGYGLCFFTFLCVDRLIAWSVAHPEPLPYIIWFRSPYELGLDWALLSLLCTLAALQHTVYTLSDRLFPKTGLMTTSVRQSARDIKRFHLRQLLLVAMIGLGSIVGTYYGIRALDASSLFSNTLVLLENSVTMLVYWTAAASYLFLAIGLYNLLFSLILSHPHLSIRSFLYALGTNVGVGLLLSRLLYYEYAVFGLLAGSVVLAVLSFIWTRRFLNTFAYHYYAAF